VPTCSLLLGAVIRHNACMCCITAMPTKIFVGRLADGISSEDIRTLFRKFGAVTECDVLTNIAFVVSNHARIIVTAYKVIFVISVFFVIVHVVTQLIL